MTPTGQPTWLAPLAAPYLEVWEQDQSNPELYHYEGETLTDEALRRRVERSSGLTVIRLVLKLAHRTAKRSCVLNDTLTPSSRYSHLEHLRIKPVAVSALNQGVIFKASAENTRSLCRSYLKAMDEIVTRKLTEHFEQPETITHHWR